jgi:hypothetical protein
VSTRRGARLHRVAGLVDLRPYDPPRVAVRGRRGGRPDAAGCRRAAPAAAAPADADFFGVNGQSLLLLGLRAWRDTNQLRGSPRSMRTVPISPLAWSGCWRWRSGSYRTGSSQPWKTHSKTTRCPGGLRPAGAPAAGPSGLLASGQLAHESGEPRRGAGVSGHEHEQAPDHAARLCSPVWTRTGLRDGTVGTTSSVGRSAPCRSPDKSAWAYAGPRRRTRGNAWPPGASACRRRAT